MRNCVEVKTGNGQLVRIWNAKPFSLLVTGQLFRIKPEGCILMKLNKMFRAVYLTGSSKGKTWAPKNFAGQLVLLETQPNLAYKLEQEDKR